MVRLSYCLAVAFPLLLAACGAGYGRVGLNDAPKIVNVSSYDPKERQRRGDPFSERDVSALRRNGASGLIARTGKGRFIDPKCADFLGAADREGLLLGTYYFVLKDVSPTWQADRYVERLREMVRSRGLQNRRILLVGDFDSRSSAADLVAFIDRIEQQTGVLPVIYLENSATLRRSLSGATPAQKRRIRQCPYWLALYSHNSGFITPQDLLEAYDIWDDWAMWQYGGVAWERGRSASKHYHHGPWRAPAFFGTMDRPLEHNAFNGNRAELQRFWQRHSWQPR